MAEYDEDFVITVKRGEGRFYDTQGNSQHREHTEQEY